MPVPSVHRTILICLPSKTCAVQVKELCSGDKILLAAQARAEEAEAALEKLQEEYKKLEHAYA